MELDIRKRTWAEIDLDALRHNFQQIRNHIGDSKLCCVVKADGYGHGAAMLTRLYSQWGADFFAVSNLDEAIELRENGIVEPVLVLGYTPVALADKISQYNLTQAVYGYDYARGLSHACVRAGVCVDVHIKIDTGMSRIGFMCQSFPRDEKSVDEIEAVCRMQGLSAKGIMAHFSVADEGDAGEKFTLSQLEAFKYTVNALKDRGITFELVHHANSGATENYSEAHLSMVRAGIILYGLYPNPSLPPVLELRSAMTLKSSVAFVKNLFAGSSVSYGRTFVADRDMRVATVPIGYADGYFRALSAEGYMSIKGKKAKILGRICMDQTIIDVTDIDDVKIGDEVVIFSGNEDEAPTVDVLAQQAGTINYEIVCAVSKRVPRVYLRDGKIVDVMYKL